MRKPSPRPSGLSPLIPIALGYVALADILTFAGRPEEAIGLMEKAMRLDPAYPAQYFIDIGPCLSLDGAV